MRPRRLLHLGLWAALVAGTHLLAVWAIPRAVMQRVLSTLQTESAVAGVVRPALPDHRQRRVVMPSPDLLYALCVLDLERSAAWRVRAQAHRAGADGYWSVALYADNSDNFFVIGDRELGRAALDLRVVRGDGAGTDAGAPAPAAARTVVHAPGGRVLLLMRVLVGDRTRDLAAAEAARDSLRCEPALSAP